MDRKISIKVRQMRKQKNITLKQLSGTTGLSVSFLSQFERNLTSITLVSLKKIAEGLQISMTELFEGEEQEKSFVHKPDSKNDLMGRVKKYASYERLSGKFEKRKLESFLIRIAPMRQDYEMCMHEGEEFIYILNGKAMFTVDGENFEVKEGESIHYPSTLLHKVINPAEQELVFLCVVTPVIF